jgi:hypothetical protein
VIVVFGWGTDLMLVPCLEANPAELESTTATCHVVATAILLDLREAFRALLCVLCEVSCCLQVGVLEFGEAFDDVTRNQVVNLLSTLEAELLAAIACDAR